MKLVDDSTFDANGNMAYQSRIVSTKSFGWISVFTYDVVCGVRQWKCRKSWQDFRGNKITRVMLNTKHIYVPTDVKVKHGFCKKPHKYLLNRKSHEN